MKLSKLEAIRARVVAHDDRTLLNMVTIEAADYLAEVVDVARAELRARGVQIPSSTKQYLSTIDAYELRDSALFCEACYAETRDEAYPVAGEMFFRRLGSEYAACRRCGSVVRDHCIAIFGFPLVRLGSYRVKQLEVPWPGRPQLLASRRLKREEGPVESTHAPKRKLKRRRRRPGTERTG